MAATLSISVDKNTLESTLVLNEENDRVLNELKILCSTLSENYSYHNLIFSIPWFELRRGLPGIARIRKREGLIIGYNEFAKSLIQEVVKDKKNLKNKKSDLVLSETELEESLTEAGFSRKLKNEQKRDTLRLLNLNHGANFSVPGAGKTTTLLAVHTILKKLELVSKLFVISPINALISWEDEINEIFGEGVFSIVRLNRSHLEDSSILEKLKPDVILVNYEKMRRDIGQLVPFFLTNKVHLILDESHRVKSGMNNISYNQIIKLADLAKRRDILSGTPMPQSYSDLEPQFDFIWPGADVIPSLPQVQDQEEIVKTVNEAIEGLFVRTTKNELGLKDPVVEFKMIPMGPIQSDLYQLFKSETARVIAGLDKATKYNFRRIGRSVIKLLQASTNPMLLTAKDEYEDILLPLPKSREFWELLEDFQKYEKPVKIEYLRKRVKEITSEDPTAKVLIWSYFVRNILILEKLFKDYNPVSIYGGIPTGSDEDEAFREGRIRKFHEDPTCRVMIANPQACGEGISLHKVCHYAIYLDRNFNAAFFLQSIDRIHRLGLDKDVDTKIEILICENSIDEVLITRLNDKIKAMGSVLDDPYLHSLAYDPADISLDDESGIDSHDFDEIKKHVSKDEKKN